VDEGQAGDVVIDDPRQDDDTNAGETMDAPGKDRVPPKPDDRDAGDVIEGDIGEARLREPSDGERGADLDKLRDVVEIQQKQEEGQG
jgi:hypothetical protein